VVRGVCPALPLTRASGSDSGSGYGPGSSVFPFVIFNCFVLLYIDEFVIEAFEMMRLAAALFSVDLLVRMSGCTETTETVLESKAYGNVHLPCPRPH
jgi:hypothetical protein